MGNNQSYYKKHYRPRQKISKILKYFLFFVNLTFWVRTMLMSACHIPILCAYFPALRPCMCGVGRLFVRKWFPARDWGPGRVHESSPPAAHCWSDNHLSVFHGLCGFAARQRVHAPCCESAPSPSSAPAHILSGRSVFSSPSAPSSATSVSWWSRSSCSFSSIPTPRRVWAFKPCCKTQSGSTTRARTWPKWWTCCRRTLGRCGRYSPPRPCTHSLFSAALLRGGLAGLQGLGRERALQLQPRQRGARALRRAILVLPPPLRPRPRPRVARRLLRLRRSRKAGERPILSLLVCGFRAWNDLFKKTRFQFVMSLLTWSRFASHVFSDF